MCVTPGALDDLNLFEPRFRVARIVEESGPISEVARGRRRAASRRAAPPPGTAGRPAPPPRDTSLPAAAALACSSAGLDPVGDEVKSRAALHLERLAGVVGEHEDRVAVRGSSPQKPVHGSGPHGPGPPPNMLRPITVAPMSSNQPSTIGVLALSSPPSSPCSLRKARSGKSHSWSLHPADPERVLCALVRDRGVAVQRDRHVQPELAHPGASVGTVVSLIGDLPSQALVQQDLRDPVGLFERGEVSAVGKGDRSGARKQGEVGFTFRRLRPVVVSAIRRC